VKDCNWLFNPILQSSNSPIQVKLRSVTRAVDATLVPGPGGTAQIHLTEPQFGISPGQAAVCYDGPRVLGGGWICGSDNKSIPLAA